MIFLTFCYVVMLVLQMTSGTTVSLYISKSASK